MENVCNFSRDDENMDLPPGFRFHPTDEELITHYLSPKFLNTNFDARAIGEVDLNKVEPWDLPWRAKMGEKEWYFFCVKDRKYPTGSRTNRATDAGYWKATGKDREIYHAKTLVGMKKTLVFYKGRAPKGEKTNWVMHEFRLEGKYSMNHLPKTEKNEWVICRIFHKSSGGKKIHISGLVRSSDYGEFRTSNLPPLLDLSHVTCFSNQLEDQKPQDELVSVQNSFFPTQFPPYLENSQFPDSVWMQDVSIQRLLLDNNGPNMRQGYKAELSQDTGMSTDFSSAMSNHEMGQRSYEGQEYPITSDGPVDLDCLWNF